MERRAFLSLLAGSPLVFGLRELLAQEPAVEKPAYFQDALKRMKELDSPGVVLLVPETLKTRELLGNALYKRLTGDSAEIRRLMTGAVFICLPHGVIPLAADDKSNRILLDPDGKKVAGDRVELSTLQDPVLFLESFKRLIHGEKGERLAARAARAREASPAGANAIKDLDSEEIAVREAGTALLVRDAAKLQPLLVKELQARESSESGQRLRTILEKLFQDSPETEFGPRLPFGGRIKDVYKPLGEPDRDPCPGCGMGSVTYVQLKFLRFLSHPKD